MQQQNIPISTLVDMYRRGELRLPEIQRHYVWRGTQVRDLFDSLYRGYPSGSILMWETDEPVPTRDFAVAQDTTAFAGRKLLLDGQQRLTSLTAVLSGQPVTVRGRKRPVRILFNLEHPEGPPGVEAQDDTVEDSPLIPDDEINDEAEETGEETAMVERLRQRTFVVGSRAIEAQPHWVSVSDVFEKPELEILKKAGVVSLDDPRLVKYQDRLARVRAIRNYTYVVHVLEREKSYEEVTEIFVRVNSLGAKLKSSDLALAQMTSRWPHLLQLLETFQGECEASGFSIEIGQLVRAIVVFATRQCLFRSVAATSLADLQNGWEQAKTGLNFAISFLRANAGIEDQSLLSSPMFLHALAAFGHAKGGKLTQDEEHKLLRWLYVANARGRYSRGSSETLLNEDLAVIFRRQGDPAELLAILERQFGRLHIEPLDLKGRGAGSPLFSLAYLALKDAGAKDWHSGLAVSLAHQGKMHFIQWHHIYPKALLREAGYETGDINEIANMAFISGRTNQQIGRKPPHEYLPAIIAARGPEALESQCVPAAPETLTLEAYPEFLARRREALAERMNSFIRNAAGLV